MPDLEQRLADLERRVARMHQSGVIFEADYDAARVRVRVEGDDGQMRDSDWLPWATRRAGGDIDWWAPEIGEQVEIVAPNGEMTNARVIPAYYSDAHPAPANSPDTRLIRFGNGAEIRHERETGLISITTPGGYALSAEGDVTITAGGAVRISGKTVDLN